MAAPPEILELTRTPQEKTSLARQISATDSQINRLVYDTRPTPVCRLHLTSH